ncbi:dicarboxylate/amino acid:cation symporter [Bermanella marisrubri]|uniref:Proton/glutamate symporter n=1 Tax=Bermanella marisrubri TaxID=207949 RepID=Q1N402_9GAMM|nr:dicarboxylate/amino acid:cation symporter [Bermanella marisrubri]EAT13063.1 proton/glutamate symporter [Oceanobacter sp. RED65] [Bermanella marisrubri]QIZ82820.1 dicarboxylate/amino acid:cation symporter [Bermanella marisrubri]
MIQPQGLTKAILLAMILAIVTGSLAQTLYGIAPWYDALLDEWLVGGVFFVVGKVFVATLKLLVVPLVLVSLVYGVSNLGGGKDLGRLGAKTLLLYLATTAIAISLAMAFAFMIEPGVGADLSAKSQSIEVKASSFVQVLVDIVPTNPITAMAEGKMLQVIVFALLLGLALNHSGAAGKRLKDNFSDWNEVILNLVTMLMKVAPYGVFALLFNVFASKGLSAIAELAVYFVTVLLVLFIHAGMTYGLLVKLLARLSPATFFKKMRNVQLFAFSTASSNATIPITMRTVEKRLGADNSIASFTVPMGATLNMDGTAIMQGVATVFIAQAYGIDLSVTDFLTVIATATLASIGTAGVPGVGLVMLSMVLTQVGLPVEGIALIIGVDRLLDMTRTAVNVTGDAAVTCVVAKSEQRLDEAVFADPNAGGFEDARD